MSARKLHGSSMIVLAIAVALGAPALWGEGQGSCSMAGTWYGGGNEVKYLMSIFPGPGSDFTTIGDGAYSLSALGFPVKTAWMGSLVKDRGVYENYAIGMVNDNTGFPAPTPQVWAVHATVRLIDCDTLRFDYDFFGAYLWASDKTPFLDLPDYVVVPPPFSETYRRMPTGAHRQRR